MTAIVYGAGALRDEIGSGRRLTYVWGLHVSTLALDDSPIREALENRVLDDLLRRPDLLDDEQDVAGPLWVDEDTARAWHETNTAEVARDVPAFAFTWPACTVLLVVGAHVPDEPDQD